MLYWVHITVGLKRSTLDTQLALVDNDCSLCTRETDIQAEQDRHICRLTGAVIYGHCFLSALLSIRSP